MLGLFVWSQIIFSSSLAHGLPNERNKKAKAACGASLNVVDVKEMARKLWELSSKEPREIPEVVRLLKRRVKDESFFKKTKEVEKLKEDIAKLLETLLLAILKGNPAENAEALNTSVPDQRLSKQRYIPGRPPILNNVIKNWSCLWVQGDHDDLELSGSVASAVAVILDNGGNPDFIPPNGTSPFEEAVMVHDFRSAALIALKSSLGPQALLESLSRWNTLDGPWVEREIDQIRAESSN